MKLLFRMPFGAILLVVAMVVLGLPNLTLGQGTSASLTGTVTDASGAAITGASVKIVNTGTNYTLMTKTDGVGVYLLRPFPSDTTG